MKRMLVQRIAMVVALGVVAACGLSGGGGQAAAQGEPHVLFGAWVNKAYAGQSRRQQILTLEAFLGRKLAIDHEGFFGWKSPLPTSQLRWDIAAGRHPFVAWHQASSASINSGTQDAFIRRRALAYKALGGSIMLAFGPEMDRRTIQGTPQQFIDAWTRVRSIFARAGAANVAFVWCPTAYGFATGRAQPYYPGDDEVGWLCADGYNWGTIHPSSTWSSFPQVFRAFLDWAHSEHPGVPAVLGEWASVEDPDRPGRKAEWINNARLKIEQRYPQLRGLIYFDTIGYDATTGARVDWRANTSQSAYDAFKRMADDPYYTAFSLSQGS